MAVHPNLEEELSRETITNKAIILDLDSTLIFTHEEKVNLKKTPILSDPDMLDLRTRVYYLTIEDYDKRGSGKQYSVWGVTRPHTKEFLHFCFAYFKVVAVWSAGQKDYVEDIINYLFRDIGHKPHIIFTRDDCVKDKKLGTIKPLTKMYEFHPLLGQYMTESNTLILDDNHYTFEKNLENAIHCPAYEPDAHPEAMREGDDTLLQCRYWFLLKSIREAKDVRKLEKDTIFTTPVDYYIKEIRKEYGEKI